ncbi:MAG: type I restriction-modification system subunit M N-terminal domain-containing protein [Chromatiales bacterium]|nr:type I restriction-modification system subunit M N-terminal domain-containing protein [Chromatiales bacterium]
MPRKPKAPKAAAQTAANLGYEAQLWQAACILWPDIDAAEYKHVVLGLIFLKYISDAFEEQHARLVADRATGADPEDPDEYRALNIFWVPPKARWSHLKAQARQSTIGQLIDEAMAGMDVKGRRCAQLGLGSSGHLSAAQSLSSPEMEWMSP